MSYSAGTCTVCQELSEEVARNLTSEQRIEVSCVYSIDVAWDPL